jgi:hypothetical protein
MHSGPWCRAFLTYVLTAVAVIASAGYGRSRLPSALFVASSQVA